MSEKLSFQNISEALVQKTGVQKKVSETFCKAFFDTIVETLYMGEETIKVKGLGTFKLVEIGSRESVNVLNGERIVIPGYKKVSFTPEESVVELLNSKEIVEEQPEIVDEQPQIVDRQPEIVEQEETTITNAFTELDEILQTDVPERVEIPQNEFAGIDMLISTPESIEEIRQQLADATTDADEAVEIARKALEKKLRLQKLLERIEANTVPESTEIDYVSEEEVLSEIDNASTDDTPSITNVNEVTNEPSSPNPQDSMDEDEEERKNRAFERIMQNPTEDETKHTTNRNNRKAAIWGYSVVILLLSVIIFFLYKTFISIDAVKDVTPIQEATKPIIEHSKQNDIKQHTNNSDTSKIAGSTKDTTSILSPMNDRPQSSALPLVDVQPARPAVYIIKKGESLTRISQKFYGTKDSVQAIIRVNDFIDPNNVPIGAKIKLP